VRGKRPRRGPDARGGAAGLGEQSRWPPQQRRAAGAPGAGRGNSGRRREAAALTLPWRRGERGWGRGASGGEPGARGAASKVNEGPGQKSRPPQHDRKGTVQQRAAGPPTTAGGRQPANADKTQHARSGNRGSGRRGGAESRAVSVARRMQSNTGGAAPGSTGGRVSQRAVGQQAASSGATSQSCLVTSQQGAGAAQGGQRQEAGPRASAAAREQARRARSAAPPGPGGGGSEGF